MGHYNNPYKPGPCANCGKEYGGFMGATRWGHDYMCCSDRCGCRLKKRIENGMVPDKHLGSYHREPDPRIGAMRFRIKHLKKQLKRNGIKPV